MLLQYTKNNVLFAFFYYYNIMSKVFLQTAYYYVQSLYLFIHLQ